MNRAFKYKLSFMKKDENNETRKLFIRVATQLLYGVIQFQVVWLCCICNLTANFFSITVSTSVIY